MDRQVESGIDYLVLGYDIVSVRFEIEFLSIGEFGRVSVNEIHEIFLLVFISILFVEWLDFDQSISTSNLISPMNRSS